ncbi:DUF3786 domain-containing protein [candidate division KSB1 bacterium]|nr:DUF3786 domain-containing protein [candidate division KSB1 bacterium]
MNNQQTGIAHAWQTLKKRDSDSVSKNAGARYDPARSSFSLKIYSFDVVVYLNEENLLSKSPQSDLLLQRLGYFSQLAILWYLITARETPLSGELMRPTSLPGGQMYTGGSHVLPLDNLAQKYDGTLDEFIRRGKELGGTQITFGDAAIKLFPFPRVPVSIVLWEHDEEFPARADLLFDTTCQSHLPMDMIWSTAMMSLLLFL